MTHIEPASPVRLQIWVTPDFNLAATMGFVDPFRAANYLEAATLFKWEFMSEVGGPIRASNGASIDTKEMPGCNGIAPDFLIVSSGWQTATHTSARLQAVLRHAVCRRSTLGARFRIGVRRLACRS